MKNIFYIAVASLLLASCRIYTNYERPDALPLEGLYRDQQAPQEENFGFAPWREVFTEAPLQQLIQKALTQNADLRSADLTVQQAEAAFKTSKLAFLPNLALAPSGTIAKIQGFDASKIYQLPVSASWQIDAFGSLRNAKKQSEMTLYQTQAARQAVQTSIIAAVAKLYYTLQMLDAQLATTRETIVIWEENVRAMKVMKEAGMTTEAAVAQAEANLIELKASIPTLGDNIRATENALCTLLHETPHAIERTAFNADGFPATLATGVPLQLLENRPDVKAREMQLAYAFYGVNKARSAFYPNITLTGTFGWANNATGMVVNPAKWLAQGVASLVQPLFQRGQLTANLKISKLQQEQALLAFEQSLLSAGEEVSNALSEYQSALQKAELRQQEIVSLTSARDKTKLLFNYSVGTSYLETLTAEQTLLQARLALINDKYSKVNAAIALYQALGGGRQ